MRNIVRISVVGLFPQLVAILVLYAAGYLLISGFGSYRSTVSMLVLSSFIGIAASGQTVVALLGGIDLSIPSVIALANVMTAELTGQGWPLWTVLAAILSIALVVGAINGAVSKLLAINPLIVTLASGAIVSGAVLAWTGGQPTGYAPAWLSGFVAPSGLTFGIRVPGVVILWALFAIAVVLLLRRTVLGRWIYASGASLAAAGIAGVPTTLVWVACFAFGAVGAAITGILLAGFTAQGDVTVAAPYLFNTIACVVVGGTSLNGARGGYARSVLGALILTEITTLLVALNFGAPLQQALLGALIVLVVASYGRDRSASDRL